MKKTLLELIARLQGMLGRAAFGDDPAPGAPRRAWRRSPARDRDRILLSQTHLWLRKIPSAWLPKHLCRHHPHLANRFAECWGDKERIEQLVDDLLIDRRGGRKGFSARVRVEMEELERFHARWLANPTGVKMSLAPRRRRPPSRVSVKADGAAADEGEGPPAPLGDKAQRSSLSISGL